MKMSSGARNTKNISPLSAYDDYEHRKPSNHSKTDQIDSPARSEQKINPYKRLRCESQETTSSSKSQGVLSTEKRSSPKRHRLTEDDRNYDSENRNKFSTKREDRREEYRSHSNHRHRGRSEKDERRRSKIHHDSPGRDPTATKNLYVGNLDESVSSSKLLEVFERYGIVETIDIKYTPYGAVYAFVTMTTLNMAYKAKTELSEEYIGRSRCIIGYGRIIPTTAVWVGGLNSQVEKEDIKKLFDRFGKILKIEHRRGTEEAQIWYKSVEEATEAVHKMRGRLLPGSKKRFRTDFGDDSFSEYMKQRSPSSNDDVEFISIYRQDLCEVLKQSPRWEGDFILKNQKHAVKLQLLESSRKNSHHLLRDVYQLDITYKLKLEVPKLANIQKTISQSSSYQIFLGLPNMEDVTKQPLSKLIRYLKEKSVAGFLHLSNKEGVVLGFLYIFPPCDVAMELIRRTHQVSEKEVCEFLVCVSILRS